MKIIKKQIQFFFQDKAFSLFHIRIYVHNLQQQLSSLENTISVLCTVSHLHSQSFSFLNLRGTIIFSFLAFLFIFCELEKAKKKAKQIKTKQIHKIFFERGSVHINYCFQSNSRYFVFLRAQAFKRFKFFSRH